MAWSPLLDAHHRLEVFQHLCRVRVHAHVVHILKNQGSFLVEHLGDSTGREIAGVGDSPVVKGQGSVIIAPELVLKALFFGPGRGDAGLREASADNRDIQGGELVVEVAVPATLLGSTRGVGEGIEPDDGRMSEEIGLTSGGSVQVGGRELWCGEGDLWDCAREALGAVGVDGQGGRAGIGDLIRVVIRIRVCCRVGAGAGHQAKEQKGEHKKTSWY
jgi:hypothetical protein